MIRLAKAILVLPILVSCWLYRAGWLQFDTVSFALAIVPGKLGQFWRRQWYQRNLQRCGKRLVIFWMASIQMPETCVGDDVFIGPFSTIIAADIGSDVMIGTRVSVARGSHQHSFARTDIPMNRQGGQARKLKIGSDVWIGTGATIIADIAPGSIVGAGAVVTKTFEPYSILAGVPARILRTRTAALSEDIAETEKP